MLRRILSPWPVRIAVLLLTLWVGCSALCSVAVPVPIWVWLVLIPVFLWESYAPHALAPVCDFNYEHNLRRNDALFASAPLPAGSRVIASYAPEVYGRRPVEWHLPGGRSWAGTVYQTSKYVVRLPPGLAPAQALRWYADNLPVINPDWQPTRVTAPSVPGGYWDPHDEYGRARRVAAPWPQPTDDRQFIVFRNGKAGLSVEYGKYGDQRSNVRIGDDQRDIQYRSSSAPPDTRERLPDPQRDIIVAVNFLAYDPPGSTFCPKLGY